MSGRAPIAAMGVLALVTISVTAAARPPAVANGDGSRAAASCIVRRQPAFSAAWLNALPGSPAETALIEGRRKDVDACLKKSGMNLDAATQPEIRRGTAGALLMRNFARLPATAPSAPGSAPWFSAKIIFAPNAKFDRATLRTESFANCVALSQWPETVALLAAPPESASQAAEALRPSLAACLSPSLTVALKFGSLRAMLAEAVYHILSPAGAGGAAVAS